MGYNDFSELITRNTTNQLDKYKELCRMCLENHANGVDISENSCSSTKRREAIQGNYITITKQYLPTSDEYPKFVCPACELNLSELARFAQKIEENAGNWEIFLSMRRMDERAGLVDAIKIEFCDEKCDNDTYDASELSELHPLKFEEIFTAPPNDVIPDASELSEVRPLKFEEIFTAPLNDVVPTAKPRKSATKKPKFSFVTTEFERTCQHCDEPTFSSLTRMYSHQKLMHPDIKAYSCDHCGGEFRSKDAVIRHMKERHANNGRKHQCQFCAKLFFSDREVRGHEKCHLNERAYVCSMCGKGFNNKTELNAHLKSKAHNANYKTKKHYQSKNTTCKKVYRCTQCVPATVYPSAEERSDHRDSVHKIFDCDVCKNSFLTIESLQSHKLLHSNKPRPHVCSVCNATFNQSSHLSSHIKCKHTERDHRAFQCSFCDKTFSENFNLTSHVNLVHRKGERAKCNECAAHFSSAKYLQRHMQERHSTKPSPYDCKDCGKKNHSGQRLALHRLKFHKR